MLECCRALLLACGALLLAACASSPPGADYPREGSRAIAQDGGARLGRVVGDWARGRDGRSGFRLLPAGIDSFSLRAAMLDAAERTLDIQYYILRDDDTGRLFISRVLAAADRGVRVRLLLDDANMTGDDARVATLAAHPNLQVRLFNPFNTRSGAAARALEFALGGYERLSYRMHNKVLVSDNAIAVAGGRNIGDDYFSANRSFEFGDFDIFVAGPHVRRLSASFDAYWNSALAVPAQALQRTTPEALATYRTDLEDHRTGLADSDYERGLRERNPLEAIVDGTSPLVWAHAEVLYDSPEKEKVEDGELDGRLLRVRLMDAARAVQQELVIVTPYLVPGPDQIGMLQDVRRRGARVRILTNSLASTDVPIVHAGYRKVRVPLLQMGVALHEVKPQLGRPRVGRTTLVREPIGHFSLHAKVFVFDRQRVFVGSANFDMRSFRLNTGVGLLIDSPELARQALERFDAITVAANSYAVRLADDAGMPALRWVTEQEDRGMVELDQEPGAGVWREVSVGLLSLLPIDEQL